MSVLMWFHTVLAVAALGLGPLLFLRHKGTRTHRWLGFAYAAAMLLVAVTGVLVSIELGRASVFLVFSAITLLSISAGLWAIWKAAVGRPARLLEAHFHAMSWSYAGLVLALSSQVVLSAARWGLLPPGRTSWLVFMAVMVVGNLVAWWLIERLRSSVLQRHQSVRYARSGLDAGPRVEELQQ